MAAEELEISESDQNLINTHVEYWTKVLTKKEYPTPTAIDYFKMLQSSGIQIDDENEKVVKLLCFYFGNDSRFEEQGGSLKKGILLRGPIGCGKTTLLRKFSSNHRQSFLIKACIDISDGFAQEGTESLSKYYGLHRTGNVDKYFGQTMIGHCFDDLGTEDNPAIHFALRINVMEKIFFQRYHKGIPANATLSTTNLPNDDLKTFYGERVYDRMREMLNIIDFPATAKSRRK